MKLVSFNCSIEVSKDENGYSNNYYVDITEQGVSLSVPYVKQSGRQVRLVNDIINQLISGFNSVTEVIDTFNKNMKLEQCAPQAVTTEETASEVSTETTEESTLPQEARGGSDAIDNPSSLVDEIETGDV